MGKVLNVSKPDAALTVHKHAPVSDGRLRLKWKPIYIEGGALTIGTGTERHTETVMVKHVICVAHLNDGVRSHSIARRLDNMHYTFDDTEFSSSRVAWFNQSPGRWNMPDCRNWSTSLGRYRQ